METTTVRISLVVAVAENGVIGRRGGLPWRLPSELANFRRLTLGKPLIMGRKTYESLPRALDGRDLIVLSRDVAFDPNPGHPHTFVCPTPDAALAFAHDRARARGVDEIIGIGGADVFAALLPQADRLYFTRVHGAPEGDVFFPPLDTGLWRSVGTHSTPRDSRDEFAWTLDIMERIAPLRHEESRPRA